MNIQELRESLEINPQNMDEELCKQSARAVQAAEYALEAEIAYATEQIKFEEFMGQKDSELRAVLTATRPKPPTVAEMEAALAQDKEVIAYKHKLVRLEANKKVTAIVRDGWRSRKDLLIQKAIDLRSEREHLGSEFIKGSPEETVLNLSQFV